MTIFKRLVTVSMVAWVVVSISFLLYPPSARAANEPALAVDSATGAAGQVVSISVTIRGLEHLGGVTGISGGQFELVYNPAVAVVENVIQGRAIGSSFMFLHNRDFAPDKVRVAWAAENGLISQDGTLCTITFKLLAAGNVTPSIENLVLYNQDLQPLQVVSKGEGNDAFFLFSSKTELPFPDSSTEQAGGSNDADGEEDGVEQPPDETGQKAFSAGFFSKPVLLVIPAVLAAGGIAFLLLRRKRKNGKTPTRRGKSA